MPGFRWTCTGGSSLLDERTVRRDERSVRNGDELRRLHTGRRMRMVSIGGDVPKRLSLGADRGARDGGLWLPTDCASDGGVADSGPADSGPADSGPAHPDSGSSVCIGRVCGPDGVGGDCGHCRTGEACTSAGRCVCTPSCVGRACGTDGCGGDCGACPAGSACSTAGACVVMAGLCSAMNPTGTCSTGQTCLGGACCATRQTCGAVCCDDTAVCVRDAVGALSCQTRCVGSVDCASEPGSPCCAVLHDRAGNPIADYGVCLPTAGASQCRCTDGTECASGSCAPSTDSAGAPTSPYVCVANDSRPYHGCHGTFAASCPDGYCCLGDDVGNVMCAQVCTNDTMCGTGQCIAYATSHSTCRTTMACGRD